VLVLYKTLLPELLHSHPLFLDGGVRESLVEAGVSSYPPSSETPTTWVSPFVFDYLPD